MSGPDRIEVHGIRVVTRHGVLPEEKYRPQPFEIDLVIEADLGDAGLSDDLADTVDYGEVVGRVSEVATSRSFGLLEALAEAVAGEVLSDERAEAVTVRVRKLRVPLASDVHSVEVVIRRTR